MKRSSVTLVLAGSLPLALTACSPPEQAYTVSQSTPYDSVDACVADNVPRSDCQYAYARAQAEFARSGPSYATLADCEAATRAGACLLTTSTRYQPRLEGFELETLGEVTQSQLDAANAQVAGSALGGAATGLVAGMLLKQVVAPDSRRYNARPLSRYGTGPNVGTVIQRKEQEEQGSGGGSSGGGGYSSSSGARASTASSISRGGFGSEATARAGWGGKSSSFFGG
ncbi:DUF1190 domain-containing protein [Pseudomonas entomophila]|uniref:DUF1190 domain-containing protein n=1 Tax=Pseudomonas entomophila TaxID=312306 RepID=UPI0023D85904|nr:DUF1190 domain-containing protein [Pseudomonas entomophila]MDF0733621.1 DUF1190 domain-containing protein [Pseudomonas entomophila]